MNESTTQSGVFRTSLPEHVLKIRQEWSEYLATMRQLHDEGGTGRRIVTALSDYRDQIIIQVYQLGLERSADADLGSSTALVMHGGCGRRDVAPFSDVDLMLACQTTRTQALVELAKFISQSINDIGFRLGFSVQTPRSACTLAQHEPATFSSFIDSRFLIGNLELFEAFFTRLHRLAQRRGSTLIREILHERELERSEFGDTVYLLRPDIKRSAGGLRDIHLIRWIGFLKHGETDFEKLSTSRVLTSWDTTRLNDAGEFLLRLRNELHFHAAGANDRLSKAEQIRIAEKRRVAKSEGLLPVEVFMRQYFHHTSEVRYCSDHFISASLFRGSNRLAPLVTRTIENRFRVGLFQVGVKPNLLDEVAHDLEQILRLMQLAAIHNKEIEHSTWQAIRESMTESDGEQLDPNCAARFMALLSNLSRLGTMLRRLHELLRWSGSSPASFTRAVCCNSTNTINTPSTSIPSEPSNARPNSTRIMANWDRRTAKSAKRNYCTWHCCCTIWAKVTRRTTAKWEKKWRKKPCTAWGSPTRTVRPSSLWSTNIWRWITSPPGAISTTNRSWRNLLRWSDRSTSCGCYTY